MDRSTARVLSEVKRGADLSAALHGVKLAQLAQLGYIERIPGTAEYDYRLTETGRLALVEHDHPESIRHVAIAAE